MTIKVMREPRGAERALRRGIEELAEAEALDPALAAVDAVEGPLRVFSLDASALKLADPLSKARPVAWRYTLLDAKGRPVGFAEIASERRKRGLVLAQVGAASAASSVRAALAAADKQTRRRTTAYEARLLRFPAAYLTAIWLVPANARPASRSGELLIPVAPAPQVEARRAYAASDLLESVRHMVEQQLAHKVSQRRA